MLSVLFGQYATADNASRIHVVCTCVNAGDDRTVQTRSRLRRKLSQRKASDSNNSNNSTQNTKKSTHQKSTANGLFVHLSECVYCSEVLVNILLASRIWTSLPSFVTSSSLSTFKQHLKTYLFATSYWWRCPSCFFLCLPNTSSSFCVCYVSLQFFD